MCQALPGIKVQGTEIFWPEWMPWGKDTEVFGMSKCQKGHPGAHSSSFSFPTLDFYVLFSQAWLPLLSSSSEEQAVC